MRPTSADIVLAPSRGRECRIDCGRCCDDGLHASSGLKLQVIHCACIERVRHRQTESSLGCTERNDTQPDCERADNKTERFGCGLERSFCERETQLLAERPRNVLGQNAPAYENFAETFARDALLLESLRDLCFGIRRRNATSSRPSTRGAEVVLTCELWSLPWGAGMFERAGVRVAECVGAARKPEQADHCACDYICRPVDGQVDARVGVHDEEMPTAQYAQLRPVLP